MGEARGRLSQERIAIEWNSCDCGDLAGYVMKKVTDTGIPELRSWEKHTIGQKVGISIWEKLGLQEMADQKPLPFDIRQVQAPDNPFAKRK